VQYALVRAAGGAVHATRYMKGRSRVRRYGEKAAAVTFAQFAAQKNAER